MDRLPASGALHLTGLVRTEQLSSLAPLFDGNGPGARIDAAAVQRLAAVQPILDSVRRLVGGTARAVRAIAFDKRADANWALAWHQDRTIEVRERREVPGFGPWTVKQGRLHVVPPFTLIERMITARLHLDSVDAGNAPLLVAPGSHCLGLIPEPAIGAAIQACGTAVCLAEPGDVWLYATPILHASARVNRPTRRRVLQVDFSVDQLPGGLEWAAS